MRITPGCSTRKRRPDPSPAFAMATGELRPLAMDWRCMGAAGESAEAVLSVLDGQGLAYAVALDRSGTRVQTLLMSGGSPVPAAPSSPARPAPRVAPSAPERAMRESVVEDQPLEDGISEPDSEPQLPPDTGRPNMLPPKVEPPPPAAGVFLPVPGSAH